MKNYALKEGYIPRAKNAYYEDYTGTITYQPDVYTAAVKLAKRIGAKTIIDIGSGNGEKLIPYKDQFKFIFVDYGSNLKLIEGNIGKKGNKYIHQDFEKGFPKFSQEVLKNSIVICSDVIEHIVKPEILIKSMVDLAKSVPFVFISTPDRLRTRWVEDYGPPQNPAHVREWSTEELHTLLRSYGLKDQLVGNTRSNDYEQMRQTAIIVTGTHVSDVLKATDEATQPDISLKANEHLMSPNPRLKIGSVINDAKSKGYGVIEAQVVYVKPSVEDSWPTAGIARQDHGLLGRLGEVRKFTLSESGVKHTVYPFRLTIFSPKRGMFRGISGLSRRQRVVDTGHFIDDYMLEVLVGWEILDRQSWVIT